MTNKEFESLIEQNTIPGTLMRAKGVTTQPKTPSELQDAVAKLKSLKGPFSEANLARLKALIEKFDGAKPAQAGGDATETSTDVANDIAAFFSAEVTTQADAEQLPDEAKSDAQAIAAEATPLEKDIAAFLSDNKGWNMPLAGNDEEE